MSLEIVGTDVEKGLILVKGALPGQTGAYVLVRDAVKKKLPADLPFPAAIRKANNAVSSANTEQAE
jgi:large subunit ribosomal protein L3